MNIFDRLAEVEAGSLLYKVYAKDKPDALDGQEKLIG